MAKKPKSGQAPDRKPKRKVTVKKRKKPAPAPEKPEVVPKPPPVTLPIAPSVPEEPEFLETPEEQDSLGDPSQRQMEFVESYIALRSVTRAAESVGVPEKNAAAQGSRWLRNAKIRKYLRQRRAEYWAARDLHEAEIVEFLLLVVRFNPGDYVEWCPRTKMLQFRDDADMTEALPFLKVSTSFSESSSSEGDGYSRAFNIDVKDRIKAAQLLLKVGGWLETNRPGDDRGGLKAAVARLRDSLITGSK